jgi:hypothetical protein
LFWAYKDVKLGKMKIYCAIIVRAFSKESKGLPIKAGPGRYP